MAATGEAIIKGALRLIDVLAAGEPLKGPEGADGLVALNDLIEQVNLQPLMQPAKTQLSQVMTASQATYTFGASGDNSTRPVRIYNAFMRDTTNSVDFPVNIISSDKYSLVTFKTTTSTYPFNLYYRNAYPQGVANLYPVPSAANTLFMEVQAAISSVATLATSVDLPPAYIKYFKNQLAIDISPEYQATISPVVYENAAEAKAWIKRMNNTDVPNMQNTARQAVGGQKSYGQYFGQT